MKALVYHGNKDLRVEEVLEPETQQGQVKLAVDFCGICATDIEEYLYGPVFISGDAPNPVTGKMMPLVTGHEITGTVIEIAPGVSNISIGDRVALNGVLTCEKCYWCKSGETTQCPDMAAVGFAVDGGLAEPIVWRADRLVRFPDEVNSKDAALTEPTSVAIHAVRGGGSPNRRGENKDPSTHIGHHLPGSGNRHGLQKNARADERRVPNLSVAKSRMIGTNPRL